VEERSVLSKIVLVSQAPSEKGVRTSGRHWIDKEGVFRQRAANFLDRHLQQIGYTLDPHNESLLRPYITNVLHCWTGKKGTRDRTPSREELQTCSRWWKKELEIVRPQVIILHGKPAAESFCNVLGDLATFRDLLDRQGEVVEINGLQIMRFTIPNSTAPYRLDLPDGTAVTRSDIYADVFEAISRILR